MTNLQVADFLDHRAEERYQEGASSFRVRAYRRAADTLRGMDESIAALAEQGVQALQAIGGIGERIAASIIEFLAGGVPVAPVVEGVPLEKAQAAAAELVGALVQADGVTQCEVAGSCRREKPRCRDLDILVVADDAQAVAACLDELPIVQEVVRGGASMRRVRLQSGLEADVRVVPAESYGAALLYFTGSREHNIRMRSLAKRRGLLLNEYGLWSDSGLIAGQTEEDVFTALGLAWIPPQDR